MNKPKILFLTLNTFSLTGGIEKVSKILAKVLHDGIKSEKLNAESVKVLSLCDLHKDVDIRYCNNGNFRGYGYNRFRFSLMAIANGLKSDVIILSHINLLTIAYFVKLFKKKTRIILLAHGIEVWRNISPWRRHFFNKHIETWAVSEFTSHVLQEKHHIEKGKLKVLNNCLDPYLEVPRTFEKPKYLIDKYKLAENQPLLLTISRLSSSELYKGYDLVISAMPKLLEKYPNLVYILGGKADEGEKKRLTNLIAANNLQQHIYLAGYIADEELIDHFLLADVFVMPSKKEGFGIVFIEAVACGCPVIAGNLDGSKDALLNGELGILINPESTGELITAIDKVITRGKSEAHSLSLQQQCLSHFSDEGYRDKVVELLASPQPSPKERELFNSKNEH